MKSGILTLLAVLGCLMFAQASRAEVSTVTDVSYYEPTNSIRITATTYFNYFTWCYYDVSHWGYVRKNDEVIEMFWGVQYDGIDAYNDMYFPYDPTADYTVELYPVLSARYRHSNGDTYEDYYQYVQWSLGDPVYHPYYYGFTGPGPEAQINFSTILLGTVYSFFTGGAPVGPPDHVKVVSDTGNSDHDPDCGFPDRRITVQIVDSQGRRAVALTQPVSVRERFFSTGFPTSEMSCAWSSCTNHCNSPSGCQLQYFGGTFTDHLFAGCPPPPFPSSCGISEFVNKWVWCPRGRPEKILATNVYEVTSQHVLINGEQHYSAGTELR